MSKQKSQKLLQKFPLLLVVVLVASLVLPVLNMSKASAAQITSRSLTLQAGADPILNGGSRISAVVNHQFTFTIPTNGTLGSIKFQYCTLAAGACTAPNGLDTTSATLGTSTGAAFSSAVSTSANSIYITRVAANFAGGSVTQQLLGVTNPDGSSCGLPSPATPNCTFFVRISTYSSTDTTGSVTDSGVVTASTATQITLTGTMPESLVFCTGGSVNTTVGIPDCATASSGAISFNQLFSPTDTATTTSQMAASTNAGSGYAISVNGPTLTSGSNTISPMSNTINGAPTAGVHGVSQFGLNLKANTITTSNPAVGIEVAPAANGTNYKGEAVNNYSTIDAFKYFTGNNVADSASGGAGGTDAQIFTVSYIVNVPGSQPAGTYTTTLTYICTPTF
jgi:hypothetical protein